MSSKFFNNNEGNTLFDKLRGIASEMAGFNSFLAVVGYFRSSGYFKLRKELGDVKEIKILVGINIDDIFRKHNKALLMLVDKENAANVYKEDFIEDIVDAKYEPEIEMGIMQMYDDLKSGRLEMRIHATKNLHAKFYLCLPSKHTENPDGWVIMGSSNISDSGLGTTHAPRYELNVAMKDFDDVAYCNKEFWLLWEQGVSLTAADIDNFRKKTYLGYQPTPYELYIKVLIDTFGDQVEDDFTIQLPDGVKDLKYQKDAVIQGYQMLMKHNGLILADVVGLGKTVVATMIVKRFVEANGKDTSILVVYPPALEQSWKKTFKLFGLSRKAQFVTNGSLSKILKEDNQYKRKEEFDLIIVDEAHGFRSDNTGKYDELQRICKSSCANPGILRNKHKKIMLLSATPLNNRPDDLQNLLLLFQDSQNCSIDGIPNLKAFFKPLIQRYKSLMSKRDSLDVTKEVDVIYEEIRNKVIDKITVRRTRSNILNDQDYQADIQSQGIVFPHILPPYRLDYKMALDTSNRFYKTLSALSGDESEFHLYYARYRAIEYLKPELKKKYRNAEQIAQSLAGIYRVHMVKRLESSFYAFKKSLKTLLRITNDMIKMFEEDKVIIAPDLKVKDLQSKGIELDQIIMLALEKGYSEDDIIFKADDFDPEFIKMLNRDRYVLEKLNTDWNSENDDPKFDEFKKHLDTEFMLPENNPTGKLVLFSESVDTLEYLYKRLTDEFGRKDVLKITATNRNKMGQTVKENFDANSDIKKDNFNIILTSDVLAEGINLHQSNVIVNYDSPWNAARLIQRIGRVNRIGSQAENIYNYMFYPSQQGDKEIKLYRNALIKLQGFHSAFGEDAQIYSHEEIVKQFSLFDNKVKDSVDKKIALLREVRELYNTDRKLYQKIKCLPKKSRGMRDSDKHSGKTIVFVSSDVKTEYYMVQDHKNAHPIDFLDAVEYLRATPEEKCIPFVNDSSDGRRHFDHVNVALETYINEHVEMNDNSSINRTDLDKKSMSANNFLRKVKQITDDVELIKQCDILIKYISEGVYAKLPRDIQALSKTYRSDKNQIKNDEEYLRRRINELIAEYHSQSKGQTQEMMSNCNPQIIISESFK